MGALQQQYGQQCAEAQPAHTVMRNWMKAEECT